MHRICSDDELWRGLFERQWASRARMDFLYCEPPPFTPPGGQSWKDAFVEEMVLWDGIDWDAQGRAHDAPTDRSGEGPEYDFLFNIVLIGDSVVPKSSFIMRLCCDSVPSPHTTTIGIDFKVRAVQVLSERAQGAMVSRVQWEGKQPPRWADSRMCILRNHMHTQQQVAAGISAAC